MAKQIGVDFAKISREYQENEPLNSSFRIIVNYLPGTDSICTSIAVKFGEENQYTVAFNSSQVITPEDFRNNRNGFNLVTPKFGVEDCLNVKVAKKHLVAALKELVNDLEQDKTNGK